MLILQKAPDSIPLRRTNDHSNPGTGLSILMVDYRIIRMRLPVILHRLLFLKFLVILRQTPALKEPRVKTKSQAILLVNDQLVKCVHRSLTPMILEYFDFRTLGICLMSRNMTSF